MRGVRYLIDESGKKTGVLIDLEKHGEIWEDFYDRAVAEARKKEPRESIATVRKRIAKRSGRSN
jgi:hypothetical protein